MTKNPLSTGFNRRTPQQPCFVEVIGKSSDAGSVRSLIDYQGKGSRGAAVDFTANVYFLLPGFRFRHSRFTHLWKPFQLIALLASHGKQSIFFLLGEGFRFRFTRVRPTSLQSNVVW